MDNASPLPKVVLIGDSIRLGYAPLVAQRLAGRAIVTGPAENSGDSAHVLAHLTEWVIGEQPDVVHLNCGLHDLKRARETGEYQVPLPQYVANLRQIVQRLRAATTATLVFATTTPVLDERHTRRDVPFDRAEADVRRYNEAAVEVMLEEGVPVHDLHALIEHAGPQRLLAGDGVHYTPEGYARLAEAVADCVLRHLTIRRYRPLPVPASGPEAEAAYREDEARRDACVPPAYRALAVPDFVPPLDAADWQRRRPQVYQAVWQSLGDLPPRPAPRTRTVSYERRRGYTIERVSLDNGVDGEISALVLVPELLSRPAPAILWLHSSTPDKTQVLIPHTNGGAEPLGEAFVRRGWVVLAPDAYWHGDRAGTGPAGPLETGRAEQESLFKFHLWFGRTLWGMFVRDDQIALDYLCSRPDVDAGRIGATGMSMGSTRAWWLAALDERIAATVAVACLTRYQNLIAHGQLRQHGIYYFTLGVAQALRQRRRACADCAAAASRPDRGPGRRLARGRRACAGREGGSSLRCSWGCRALPERPLPAGWSHLYPRDACGDAGVVRALARARLSRSLLPLPRLRPHSIWPRKPRPLSH